MGMLSELEDVGRFVHDYILPEIENGQLKRYKQLSKFEKAPKKKKEKKISKKRGKEEDKQIAIGKKIRENSFNSLIASIQNKNGGRGNARIEEPEIDEDEFMRIRNILDEKRKKSKSN